jgi:capsular polysaccharide transport system ATP-binding protein
MIEFRDTAKAFPGRGGPRRVLDGLRLTLPPGARVGLVGPNGAGKTTLLALIAGTMRPDRGEVRVTGRVSWPLGFAGSFAPDLTGTQNARFVARIYGADTDGLVDYVRDFSELEAQMEMPVRHYSAGMRARLAFGVSMGLAFDWYLVDEVTAVGDAAFRRKSLAVFRDRLAGAGLIMVSHAPALLRDFCDCGIVLRDGRARFFPDIGEAIAAQEGALAG